MPKTYVYEGENYTEQEVLEASSNLNMSVDDYVSQYNLEVVDDTVETEPEKKDKDTQKKEDATAVSTSGASSSEDTSSDSTSVTKEKKPPSRIKDNSVDDWYEYYTGGGIDDDIYKADAAGDTKELDRLRKEKDDVSAAIENESLYVLNDPTLGTLEIDFTKRTKEEVPEFEEEEVEEVTDILSQRIQEPLDVDKPKNRELINQVASTLDQDPIFTDINTKDLVEEDFINIRSGLFPVKKEDGTIGYEYNMDAAEGSLEVFYDTDKYPQGQAIMELDKTIGGNEIATQRITMQGIAVDPEFKTLTTPGDFTIIAPGSVDQALGITENTIVAYNGDDVIAQAVENDKKRIDEASEAYIPKSLRPLEEFMDAKQKELESLTNIFSDEGFEAARTDEFYGKWQKILNDIDKEIAKYERKGLLKQGTTRLYDYVTGEFVDEEQANASIQASYNASDKKYQNTSYDKLKQMRYDKANELIYLANQVYKEEGIIKELSSNLLNLPRESGTLGGVQDPALQHIRDKFPGVQEGKFKRQEEIIEEVGVDFTGTGTGVDGNLLYDFWKFKKINETKNLEPGMTLIPEVTLNAKRYNDALIEFNQINRALELNIDEKRTARDTIVDNFFRGAFRSFNASTYKNEAELKSYVADFQKQIYGGEEFWNEYDEFAKGTFWERNIEGVSEGLFPFMVVILEFYLASKWLKGAQTLAGGVARGRGFPSIYEYVKNNAYKYIGTGWTNPFTSRLGLKTVQYSTAVFEEYMTIQGVNFLNNFSGQEDISGWFALGAGLSRGLLDDFSKWAASGNSKVLNNILSKYNKSRTVGSIMNGTLEPTIGVGVITVGELGEYVVTGEFEKIDDLLELDRLSQLWMTLWITRFAKVDGWKRVSEFSKRVVQDYERIILGKSIRINQAQKRLGVTEADGEADIQEKLNAEVEKVNEKYKELKDKEPNENKRKKLEEQRKEEIENLAVDSFYCQQYANYKYMLATQKENSKIDAEVESQINDIANSIIDGEPGRTPKSLEDLATWTGTEGGQKLIMENIKTKEPDLTPDQIKAYEQAIREVGAVAQRAVKELDFMNIPKGSKLRNQILNAYGKADQINFEINKLQQKLKADPDSPYKLAMEGDIEFLKREQQRQAEKIKKLVDKHKENLRKLRDIVKENEELKRLVDEGKVEYLSEEEWNARNLTSNTNIDGIAIDGERAIVNVDRMDKKFSIGTETHEVLHLLEGKSFKEAPQEKKDKAVSNFKKQLTPEEQRVVKARLPKRYHDTNSEEWMNYYHQAVLAGTIKPGKVEVIDETFNDVLMEGDGAKIKAWLDDYSIKIQEGALKSDVKTTIRNVEDNVAEEGYKPVTEDQLSEIDYNVREEFTGGEEASVNQTEQLILEKENINAQNRAMLQQGQINRDVLTANQERVKEINKELEKPTNKINKIFIDNKDIWESTVRNKNRNKEQQAQYDKIFNELYNAYQGLFIEKTNAYKNAYGLSEVEAEDFKAGLEGKRGFIDAIESFDISKQNENWGLDGWINSILKKRAPEFLPPDIGKPKSTSIDEVIKFKDFDDAEETVEIEETVEEKGYRYTVPKIKSLGKQTRLFKINGDKLFQGEKIPEETVNELKNFTSSNKDEPHLIFMAGGAGSGKTSVISELQKLDPNLKNYKVLNQDPYLEKLKEENGLPADESNYTSEQKSLRSKLGAEAQKQMLAEFDKALSEGENIILDGTAASPKALQKKLNQAQENGYTPNNTAMIAVETSVESAQAANEARPERRLPSSIVRRNHEQMEQAFKEYEVMFSEFDRGNKILGQAAKYLKVNDLPTDINDSAVRDEAYDKAVEDLGTRYKVWKEVKNDLGNRAEYEENLKEVYNLVKDLDPYLLRKYNVDIFYEPIMTESGGSQKKINNKLQWRKKIPTFEEFKSWTLADPNTINPATGKNYGAGTKGTRKDLLAKIIASQVQMDGILEVSRIAAENNGLVPVYDASGNPTGKTIDLFEGLTPGEKAERIDDAYLNKLSNKLRRKDPNQQFSEVEGEFKDGRYVGSQYDIPKGSFKNFVEEFKAAPLNERKDVIEKYFGKGKEGQEVQEDLKPITELSREEVEKYSATEQEESFPIKGEFGKSWVNSVEIHNEKHGTDIKYKSSSGIRSIFAEAAKGDKAAIKQVRNYYNQMHDLYYSLPEAFREAFPTELRALFGINKLKQYYTPEGDMSRYTLKILKELDKHNLDNPLDQLFNLYNSKPRKKPKISEEEKEANEEANEYYKEVLKAANLHSGSSASGKVKIELNKWLDSKDIKQGEKIPEELIPELKKLLQDKIKKKDYSFDETVDANKEVITILIDSIKKQLDKIVDKYGVDSNEFNTYMDNTVIFLSSQTNIADSPLKGAFTITSVATVRGEPTSYQPGGFHAEHNVAIFLFNNNLIDYLIDYAKSRDENLFNDRVDNLITQSEQAITTAQTVDIQDHVIIDGKKVKVASDFEGELTSNNIFLIKDPTFIENAIDLKGDPNEPVTLIDKFTDIAITNDQAAKLNELEIRINEMYDQQGEDLIDKIQQATDLVNKKIFNLKHDQVADQKVTDKSINDLEKAVEQYSEVEGEFERQEFDKFMDESFGDQWRKAPSSDSAAKEAGKEKDSRKILPYSAQDWKTLLYNLLPKKGGEEALKFIEDKLIKTYFRGLDALEQDQVKNIIELSVLNKSYKNESGPKLSSKPRNSNYTYDQEIRMYIWDKAGYDIPGATSSDIGNAVIRVENNPTLKAYADQLINMTEGEYTKPNESWVFGDIGSDISNALASERRSDYIAEWKSNVDNILNDENKNKLRSILGNRFMESLDDIIKRMESGSNRQTLDPLSNNIMNYINQTTGATMFFNTRSAVMQMISSMNYLNTSFNNPLAASRAFADQPQFWKDVGTLWKDPYLVSRRGTGGITLTDAELRDISNSKNSVQAFLNKLLEKGYTLTQIADSFAQVIGGAPWYRNKVKDLMKKNPDMTLEEAEVEARNTWRDKSRAEQQSGDPAMTSKQQTSTLGRTVLQYATTQQQYMRRAAQDLQDLLAGRGSFKEKMAGLMNYLVLQNAFYGFLINAGFSILTDESTPDDEKAKLIAELNSIIDANLRGLGVVGSLLSTGKNAAIKFYEEANKDRANYEKVKNTIFSASPWIGSKNNLYNKAVRNLEYSETKKYSENPEPWYSYKNPTLNAAAAATEATLAVPAEEFLRRMEAFDYMLNTSNSSWKRIAVALGYEPWQLETKQQVEKEEKKHDQQMKIKQFQKATGENKVKPDAMRGKVRQGIN